MSTVRHLRPDPAPRRRVLVVEDNLDSVQALAMLLKHMGHEVHFAINGFAAIDVARKFRPEVILLDPALPGVDGDSIARQLRWEPGLEKTPIITITGRPHEDAGELAALLANA
jgi:CheY-like chemotaxis protein